MNSTSQTASPNDGLASPHAPAAPEYAKSAHSPRGKRRENTSFPAGAVEPKREIAVVQRKKEFQKLDAAIRACGGGVIHTVEQMLPHLNEMWMLLSRKGGTYNTDRGNLPGWTEYLKGIANEFGLNYRTIQEKLALHRNGSTKPKRKKNPGGNHLKPWHADAKDSRALAGAQLAINDFISAYEAGVDMAPAYQQYKKAAVSPTKLVSILEAADGGSSKVVVEIEVKRKLVPVVETAERYINNLEKLVYSPSGSFTDEQMKPLQKLKEEWRCILRYVRGVKAEQQGNGIAIVDVPVVLKEAA